ncbi:kinase-like protein [Lentinus brumalis]|uniref:non-specific serine/threonine protein kinase n=1 Tax=Lentinus brumalis TaxID=2498619 RepID=A0A371CY07_9APHY|nr:kinase-like protein [Polyporus brumalis]
MLSKIVYFRHNVLGSGSHGIVYAAEEEGTGRTVALKASRVSLNVVRSSLRHEARVMQLLQGHSAVPVLLGYARRPHFEYMAMELLGSSLRRQVKSGCALSLGTVARVGEQMLSALEHLASHRIVHRDIKPHNILLSCVDSARVVLVDFSIAHHLTSVQATLACNDGKSPLAFPSGTTQFCSLEAHTGGAPDPHDDLESLAYVLLFLCLGDLPWHVADPYRSSTEVYNRSVMNTYLAKQALTSSTFPVSIPLEIANMLESARRRKNSDLFSSSITKLRSQFCSLVASLGECNRNPLDWTPVLPLASITRPDSGDSPPRQSLHLQDRLDTYENEEPINEYFTDSYYGSDLGDWLGPAFGRLHSLTLPADDTEFLDGQLPEIAEVQMCRLPPRTW